MKAVGAALRYVSGVLQKMMRSSSLKAAEILVGDMPEMVGGIKPEDVYARA